MNITACELAAFLHNLDNMCHARAGKTNASRPKRRALCTLIVKGNRRVGHGNRFCRQNGLVEENPNPTLAARIRIYNSAKQAKEWWHCEHK